MQEPSRLLADSLADPLADPVNQAGSSLASLWMRVNQENQPPASVPSTLASLNARPERDYRLEALEVEESSSL